MDPKKLRPLEELLDEVRDIDGFPLGEDEDILSLSNPPYYTACPNPYISEYIDRYGKNYNALEDTYQRTSYIGNESVGKHHPIYAAHTYHTKVPHQAIQKFIEYYTEEGDIVFDGFCGTGMTGVAARLSKRHAIVSDISPIAAYIAYNLLNPLEKKTYEKEFKNIINEVMDECGWMYKTKHTPDAINTRSNKKVSGLYLEEQMGTINYVVWDELYECQYCGYNICFGELSTDKPGSFTEEYTCPQCHAETDRNTAKRLMEVIHDTILNKDVYTVKQKPILVSYSIGTQNFWKRPDEYDLGVIKKIESSTIPYWVPISEIMKGEKTGEPLRKGMTYVHHLFTKRNLWVLAKFYDECTKKDMRYWFIISSLLQKASRLMALKGDYIGRITALTLYISSTTQEINIFYYISKNIKSLLLAFEELSNKDKILVSNQSCTNLSNIPSNSIDYIFTDPPFGGNIMYSELNYIWETFLKIRTNNQKEAIENKVQKKSLVDYTELMTQCFREMYRILKPKRWITIEFHNSQAAVWNSIQESISRAGFIIAQVSILDKKVGSYNQINASGAVKNDLIINAYKPSAEFEEKFLTNAGEGMEVEFVIQQLQHLTVGVNIGRTEKMLFSKLLAHYVENGYKIKYNANNFYNLLHDNFIEIDGYWFTENQAEEYRKWKSSLRLDELEDIKKGTHVLFVTDEKSALVWLYNFLNEPKEYSEIYTNYEQIVTRTDDEIPELKEMLDRNFVKENGNYRRPLNREEKSEIEKNRERELDRAWKNLLEKASSNPRKIKNVRKEALLHGLTKCYQEENYEDILAVADKLHKSVLESSGDIMDFVDMARMKLEG